MEESSSASSRRHKVKNSTFALSYFRLDGSRSAHRPLAFIFFSSFSSSSFSSSFLLSLLRSFFFLSSLLSLLFFLFFLILVLCSRFPAYKFQEDLLKTLLAVEATFFNLARADAENGKKVIALCDRGAMDPSACKQLSSIIIPFF